MIEQADRTVIGSDRMMFGLTRKGLSFHNPRRPWIDSNKPTEARGGASQLIVRGISGLAS